MVRREHTQEPAGQPLALLAMMLLPRKVLIDLGALYGRQAHFRRPNTLFIASLHYTAVAELDAWVLAETGWFGA